MDFSVKVSIFTTHAKRYDTIYDIILCKPGKCVVIFISLLHHE